MTIDIALWIACALLAGFVAGLKVGIATGGDSAAEYHRGVRAGYQLAKDGETDG